MQPLAAIRAAFAERRWKARSFQTWLVGIILLSSAPIALVLSYEVFSGMRVQQRLLDDAAQRSALAPAQGSASVPATDRRPGTTAPGPGLQIAASIDNAGTVRAVVVALGTSAACMLLGLWLGLALARRAGRTLAALSSDASGLAQLETPFVEIARLRDRLMALHAHRAQHEAQLRQADARLRDDQHRNELAQEQAARREAEAANRDKDAFLAMLSHELRNPLGAMTAAVEVLQRVEANSALAHKSLGVLGRQTANLARILDDLLEVRLRVVVPPTAVAPRARAQRQHSVVIVDAPADAQALGARLAQQGHAVQSAHDGLRGLALIAEERPDVAIVGLGASGIDGIDLARRSRAAGYPGLMVAAFDHTCAADERQTLRAGFDARLDKPVDTERLRELMSMHL